MKNSLIGYFKLNSNARDYSGYNRDGTATNVVFEKNLFGKDCAEFDGVDSIIDTGSDWIGVGDLSVSVWIKPYSFGEGNIGVIVTNFKFILRVNGSGNNLVFSSSGSTVCNNAVNSINLNQWTHVIVTRNSLGATNFYVNGELSGSPNQNSGIPVVGVTNVFIGNISNSSRAFDGLISELKVYDKVLSFDEIQKEYRSTLPEFFGKNSLKNIVPDLNDSSLKGAWLNARTVEAEDYSNHNNNGIATDMVFEKTGGKFNGSSSNIYLGKPSDLNLIDNFTISAWVNPISLSHPLANTIIAKRDALVYQYQFRVTSAGLLSFLGGSSQVRLSVSSIPLNSWSHVTLTKEGSNLKFYINGVLDVTHPNTADIVEADVNVRIGWDGQVANTYWTGGIKDLRVYSEVKSSDFIKNLFLSSLPESDLVFSCFDGLKDLSKYERNLINTNTLVGKEMVFNGVDSKISVVSDAGLDLSSNFTISCWINLNNNFNHTLVAKGEGTTSQYVLDISGGKVRVFGYQDTTSKGIASQTGVLVNDNKWHHIVGTFDGTDWITYVDGIVNNTIHSIATLTTTFDNLTIGKRGNNTASGVIKDVKVYNSVKSFDWVKKEYEVNKKFY